MIKLKKNFLMVLTTALLSTALLIGALLAPTSAVAETDELQETELSLESSAKDPAFATTVQNKYMLSNEQMKAMTDAGLKGPQLAMTAQIAASSGKPIEDIVKMRTEGKMGWGKIAKLLGVQPGVIGESVSSLRHEAKEEKKAHKEHRKELRADKKLAREEKKAERKANAEERKSQHHKNK